MKMIRNSLAAVLLGLGFLTGPALASPVAEQNACISRNMSFRVARMLCANEELRMIDYWLYHYIQHTVRNGVGFKVEAFETRINEWLASRDRCCRDAVELRAFYVASLPALKRYILDVITMEA